MSEGGAVVSSRERMRSMMADYYERGKRAREEGRPIAWVTGLFPVEILYAMDIFPLYPENHSAMCGARKVAAELSAVAESAGYSEILCSYARTDLGSLMSGESPVGGLPKPDFLLACNQQCDTVTYWYEALGRTLGVPVFVVDTPYVQDELNSNLARYFEAQLREMVSFLEEHTDRRLSEDRLAETLRLSEEASSLWEAVLNSARHVPSPLTCFDAFVHMGPIVILRGTSQAVDYYRLLLSEMEERIANGVAAVPGERHRLYWDGIAVWFRLRRLAEKLKDAGAACVVSQYTNTWALHFEPQRLWDSLTETYTQVFINTGIKHRVETILGFIRDFSVDGMIMHSNRSCKPFAFGQYTVRNVIMERTGIPGMFFEGDMCDSRLYSDVQVEASIDAFLESLSRGAEKLGSGPGG